MKVSAILALLLAATLAGCLSDDGPKYDPENTDTDNDGFSDAEEERRGSDPEDPQSSPVTVANKGPGDAVVVAVVDGGFNPYHFDFLAEHMPQYRNSDSEDDLNLWDDPANWLPGHPGADAFSSYDQINITTTPDDDTRSSGELFALDGNWQVPVSSGDNVNVRWFPGTKVIGAVSFSGSSPFASSSHGVGTSTVSVGNYHGSCPECLLVFVHGSSEQANEWVLKQDWIDAQTNSWGLSTAMRDRMYAGSDTDLQLQATDRGQQIFFSAGNGQGNTFTVPNPTLFSSQEGPDWVITVGAISPSDGSTYLGHGKPSDIASVGSGYPSGGYCNNTVNCTGNFGGTSNATPVTAGMYAKALYELRRQLEGVSRLQSDGVIATGPAGCAQANPDCAMSDGNLTNFELRTALFRGAEYTPAGYNAGTVPAGIPGTENADELTFLGEGHGSFWGRLRGDETWLGEVDNIVGFANGTWYEEQDADQRDWFIADSYCRQSAWGTWDGGYWTGGSTTGLVDPQWPVRSWLATACAETVGTVVAVEKIRDQ